MCNEFLSCTTVFFSLSPSLFLNLHLTLNKANPKQINCRPVLLHLRSLFAGLAGAGRRWRRRRRQEMPGRPAEVHVAL